MRPFHFIRRIYTHYRYSLSCCKAYSLYYDWAKQLLREVKGYKKIAGRNIDLSYGGFDKDLDKIIKAFEYIINEDISDVFNKEKEKEIEEGLQLFAKRFTHFWY